MNGFVVALVGPDGVGKSTIATRLTDVLGRPATRLYAGDNPDSADRMLPSTRLVWWYRRRTQGPPVHGPPPIEHRRRRSLLRRLVTSPLSALLLANQCAEEWSRLRLARRLAAEGLVVVLDRSYLHDYYRHDVTGADRSLRQRVHGWWLLHVLPRVDLAIVLDAPVDVLYARKAEGTAAALSKRRSEYQGLPPLSAESVTIDAGRPLDAVEADVAEAIRAFDKRRVVV